MVKRLTLEREKSNADLGKHESQHQEMASTIQRNESVIHMLKLQLQEYQVIIETSWNRYMYNWEEWSTKTQQEWFRLKFTWLYWPPTHVHKRPFSQKIVHAHTHNYTTCTIIKLEYLFYLRVSRGWPSIFKCIYELKVHVFMCLNQKQPVLSKISA